MSGHSKWSTIKRQKGVADAKRGQAFTKAANAITVAARDGGSNLESNFKLRLAVEAAKNINMPKANIEKAVARGSSSDKGGNRLEQVVYEGFGPSSVAIIVESVTDNRSRTAQEVRSVFDRSGGTMGGPGSVSHLFKQIGEITVRLTNTSPDEVLLTAAEAGADDVENIGDSEALIYCDPAQLEKVKANLSENGLEVLDAKISRKAISTIKIDEEKAADNVLSIIDKLEDLQDVQTVYANFDISEEVLRRNADIMK